MHNLKYWMIGVVILVVLILSLLVWNKIKVDVTPDYLIEVYTNSAWDFSIYYPLGYIVDENYHYQNLGQGKDVAGVKFTIDPAKAKGTNLSTDSYFSVETIDSARQCQIADFLTNTRSSLNITDAGQSYLVASSTDAGVGNRYEETVYVLPLEQGKCRAIRYFVHYGAIENYPTGIVKEFDKDSLLREFDDIRRTFINN